jgi:hypothetical protein
MCRTAGIANPLQTFLPGSDHEDPALGSEADIRFGEQNVR